jgi:hypothetical protein
MIAPPEKSRMCRLRLHGFVAHSLEQFHYEIVSESASPRNVNEPARKQECEGRHAGGAAGETKESRCSAVHRAFST